MVLDIINIYNVTGLSKQIPKLIKCHFSTLKNTHVQNIIKETEKEGKLKLSQHTNNLLKNNVKTLHFNKTSKVNTLNNDVVVKNNGISKIENVDITTVTKPLKYPVVLCHGLFGFDKKGPANIPFLQVRYWNKIQKYLEQLGCKVSVPKVSPAGGVKYRAQELSNFIESNFPKQQVHLIAHSMGGLDCRYLITHLKQRSFKVLTLTTLSTPHRGSPFMDWCRKKFGVGWIRDPKHIPAAQPSFMAKSIKNASVIFNKREQQKRHQHRQSFTKLFSRAFEKRDSHISINTNTNTYTAYSSQTSSNTCNGTRPLNIPQPSLTEKMSIYNIVNSSDEDNSNNKFINSASSYTNASVPEKENSNSLYQSSVSNENHESSITSSSSFDIGRRRTVKASNSRHSSSILNQNNTSKFNPPSSLTSILEGARNSYEKGVKVDERSYSGDSDITRCNTQDNVLNNNGNNNYDKSVRNSYLSDITRVPTTASESSEIYCEPNDIFSKLKTLNRTNMPATFNDKLNIKGSDGQDISTSLISHLGYKNGLQSQQNQQASFISAPILKKSSRQSVLYYPTLYQSQNSNVSHNNYEVPTPGRSNSDSSNALSISSTDAVSISHTNSMSSVVTTSTLDSSNSNSSPKYTNGFNTPYSYLNAAPYLPKNSFNPQCTQTSSVSGSYNGNKSNLSIPFANTRGKNMLAQSSTQNSQELYRSDSMEIEEERKFLSPPTTPY